MFEGKIVRLRAYTREDLPLALAFVNDFEVSEGLQPGFLFPLRKEDEDKWYESLNPHSKESYSFAIEAKSDKNYLGGCGIDTINVKNHTATIGIFLGKQHWRKGYGSDALSILINFCFEEVNLNKVKLNVFSYNKKAIQCYEKIGFKTEGVLRQEIYRHGKYHDNIAMGLLRSEWEKLNDN